MCNIVFFHFPRLWCSCNNEGTGLINAKITAWVCVCARTSQLKEQPPAVLTNLICLNYRAADLSSHDPHNASYYTHTHTGRETQTQGWKYISSSPSFTHKARLIFLSFSSLVPLLSSESFLPRGIEIDDKFSLCQAAEVHLRAFPPLSQYVFQSGKFSHKTSALFICPLMHSLSLSLSLSLSFSVCPRGLSQHS